MNEKQIAEAAHSIVQRSQGPRTYTVIYPPAGHGVSRTEYGKDVYGLITRSRTQS